MKMNMLDNLVRRLAIVLQNVVIFNTSGENNRLGNRGKLGTKVGQCGRWQLMDFFCAVLWNHERVAGRQRKDVEECIGCCRFAQFDRWNSSSNDFTKQTLYVRGEEF